nr:site-specific integrase [Methylicorpusculum oleiharenae]
MEVELKTGKPAETLVYTVGDALERYGREVSVGKKGERWEVIRLALLGRYALARVRLADLAPEDLALWRDQRLKEVSAASVNRELNVLSSVFTHAKREWRWLSDNPVHEIKRPKNPRPRDRRIDPDELLRVLDALGYSPDKVPAKKTQLVGAYFVLAIETALRLGEICALTVNDAVLDQRYLIIRDSKNGDQRHVSLSTVAVAVMKQILASGLSVDSATAGQLFRKAIKRADITGLHFHDSRHEALTRLARKLDVLDLARMVGHRDVRSLMIYYNATAFEIAGRLG